MIRIVVFDLGQVLASPAELYRAPAALLGVEPVAYQAVYWTDRRAYDTGGSPDDYWRPILDGVGVRPTAELIARLDTLDAAMWIDVRPSALELVHTVRSWGLGTALLSNAPLSLGDAVRRAEWVPLFDQVFISAELGTTKPDPAIFATVTAGLGVAPGEIAFIDDREPNVIAAADFGWSAHLWVDDADSLAWLQRVCGPAI